MVAAGTTNSTSIWTSGWSTVRPGGAQTASITDGTPTVNSVIADALRNSIGKWPMTSDETMTRPTADTRVRKSRRMSCIPLRMRLPSSTALASDPKESSRRTRSATPFVAWLPAPIATARFDFFSDRTSFTPSPIIAT